MDQGLLKGLTKDQIAKVKACKKPRRVLEARRRRGHRASAKQLEAVSGGCGATPPPKHCPKCDSTRNYSYSTGHGLKRGHTHHVCYDCGHNGIPITG